MKRIAIIGCGRISPAHLNGLKTLSSRAKVVALCDMNEKLRSERQKAFDVPNGFASIDELLAWDQFDIATILTPPDIRSDVCIPILKAKKHLMVEKPFSHSLDEAYAIVHTAKDMDVTMAVNQNFRWIPPAPILRKHILNGRLGRILSVLLVDAVWRDESVGWRNTTSKLALSVMGVHWLDRIRWITGLDATRLYTSSMISHVLTSAGEDITSTIITLSSGAVATFVHHWASRSNGMNNSLQVDGVDGSVIVKGNEITWIEKDGKQTKENFTGIDISQSMALSWTEFLNALDENRQPCHNGKDNLWTVALLEGVYKSAETGESIEIKVEK
ncbi:MAG: Gfo/Idh/MocA family oxidoreductase [Candidatus Poribacteria bacterium]